MKNGFQTRILAIALALATLAACVLAGVNLEHENHFDVPTDGISWMEATGGLRAQTVPVESPGYRAGIRSGDILVAINDRPTLRLAPLVQEMFHSGIWAHATYSILRPLAHSTDLKGAARLDIQVILIPTDRSINQWLRFIALVYLALGLYVLFRRWTAPKSTHFYVFCLVSFVLYSFKYTTELDTFDWFIYWGNIAAEALQPALFLHFAVSFSDVFAWDRPNRLRRSILSAMIYTPAVLLIGLQYSAIHLWSATEILRHRLDQIAVAYLVAYYILA